MGRRRRSEAQKLQSGNLPKIDSVSNKENPQLVESKLSNLEKLLAGQIKKAAEQNEEEEFVANNEMDVDTVTHSRGLSDVDSDNDLELGW